MTLNRITLEFDDTTMALSKTSPSPPPSPPASSCTLVSSPRCVVASAAATMKSLVKANHHHKVNPASLSSTNPSGKKRRPRLHWNPQVIVYETQRIKDMSEEMISSIWYSKEEYATIKEDNDSVIQSMMMMSSNKKNVGMTTKSSSSESYCTRGLEPKTTGGAYTRRELKLTTWRTILGEQHRLRKLKVKGQEAEQALARAYELVSIESHDSAFLRGLQDEKDAIEQNIPPRPPSSSSSTRNSTSTLWGQDSGNNSFGWASMESICLEEEDGEEKDKQQDDRELQQLLESTSKEYCRRSFSAQEQSVSPAVLQRDLTRSL